MENKTALIMAGGSGTRFWPRSRDLFPKQFLNFFQAKSLIQQTVERMAKIVGLENVFVILGQKHADMFLQQNPDFPESNLILEPCGRDTAAAIGLASLVISRLRPGSTTIVCPADHLIDDEDKFSSFINNGCRIAQKSGCLLTIGIEPKSPSSAYGYIEAGEKICSQVSVDAFEVKGFKEKPSTAIAQQYLDRGNYFWNSGIFIWQCSTILEEISTNLPEVYALLAEIGDSFDNGNSAEVMASVFPQIPKISIDYGVMEKSKNILTLKGDFYWDDLGSWTAFAAYLKPDDRGNRSDGLVLTENSDRCLVVSDNDALVAVSGVSDLIIVSTKDATLVCDRRDDQAVKRLVDRLKNMDSLKKFI